jgi:hypothetical protein
MTYVYPQLLGKTALIRVGATFIECSVSKICERQSATALFVAALHEVLSVLQRATYRPGTAIFFDSNLAPVFSPGVALKPLTPNEHYSGRTAPLTSKRFILCIYSTNIGTEYF